MSDQLVIRPFTNDDYEVYCDCLNTVYPEYPETPDEIRLSDSHREAKIKWGRFLAELGGTVVGVAHYGQSSSSYHPHRFFISVDVPPDNEGQGIGKALYAHLTAHLEPLEPEAIRSSVRESSERGMRFAGDRGFVETMREQESKLDLAAFDPGAYAADVERVTSTGIKLLSETELAASDPGFRRKMYDLSWLIHLDIPHTEEMTRLDFEVWEKRYERPNYLPDGCIIAVDGDAYVGTSQLWASQGTTDLFTGATGILREYRKRGLATALKVRALSWAKASGAPYVRTWNEVNNNGMLGINFRLGFARLPQWVEFVNELGPARPEAGKEKI